MFIFCTWNVCRPLVSANGKNCVPEDARMPASRNRSTRTGREGTREEGGFKEFSASVTPETSLKMGALIKSLAVLTALVAVIGADHGPHGHHGHHAHDQDHHHDHGHYHDHDHGHDHAHDPDHGPQRKRETDKDEKKFCPLEYKRNRCQARRNQFKCGVFFMNLHGQSERLRWIAALPDALVKPSLRNSPVLMRSIHNVKKRDFTVPKGDCDARSANNECLDIVSKI